MKMILQLLSLSLLFWQCQEKDEPAPSLNPKLTIGSLEVLEGNGETPVFLTLRLSAPPQDKVTLALATEDGTARSSVDYESIDNRIVTFDAGDQLEEVRLVVVGDEEFEEDEFFKLIVKDANGIDAVGVEGVVTILNDDIDLSEVFIPDNGYSSPTAYPDMDLVWSDEFDGPTIDESYWTFEIGRGNNGWGNNELQYYRKENAFIQDGCLVIAARKENFSGSPYTSTRMITKDKFEFQYGRVDIRASLPYGQGVWPALWMLGANISQVGWPSCGEIDIMELIGHQPSTVYGTAHWDAAGTRASLGGNTSLSQGRFYDAFHVFSIEWDDRSIRWYLDDQLYHELDTRPAQLSEFHQDFFFIFNVAVGGNWPGYPDASTKFPQRMVVDYVRVFQ